MANSKWKQQELPHYTFVFTPRWTIITMTLISLLCLPLGIYLYIDNSKVSEFTFDYTQCINAPTLQTSALDSRVQWIYSNSTKNCTIRFPITSVLQKVRLYIRLTNFYQNHRLYLTSLNAPQLEGKVLQDSELVSTASKTSCSWLTFANCNKTSRLYWSEGNGLTYAANNPDCMPPEPQRDAVIRNAADDAQYYPCGLVANSFFSDEISDLRCFSDVNGNSCSFPNYVFSQNDIAWKEDFKLYGKTGWATDQNLAALIPTKLIPPPAWRAAWPEKWGNGYNSTNIPDLTKWERFHVWMRKAAFPTFRKLWGINKDVNLEPGFWEVNITYNFDVLRFQGTKSIVFSEVGALGIKTSFIPIAFLVLGVIAAFLAFIVYALQIRKIGDHSYLSWNKQKPD